MAPPFPPAAAPKSPLGRHRLLSPTAGIRVSPICLGAMNFGEADKARLGECSKETAFQILDTFYGLGGNFIDTANGYQNGESEMWLGDWMASRGNRDEIVLATKFSGSSNKSKDKQQSNYGGNNSKSIRLSVETSLKRLQTTYLDILWLHWWDFSVSIPELMHSLDDLIKMGKVLYLGISDTPAWVVSKANQYARDHGLRQFVVYQGLWNGAIRDFERDIIPMCRDEGMALVPYGTLGQGRFQTEAAFKERETNNPGRQSKPSSAEKGVSKALEKIAQAKDSKVTSVAMAYVLHKSTYVFPIVGGRKVEHIKDNIDALTLSLTQEEMDEIEAANPFDHGFPHTFLSGTQFAPGSVPQPAHKPSDVWLTSAMVQFDWVEQPRPIEVARQTSNK